VTPDLHRIGMNRKQARKHAQRNLQPIRFFLGHGQKTGIFEGSGASRLSHGAIQWRDRHGISHASSKFAVNMKVAVGFARLIGVTADLTARRVTRIPRIPRENAPQIKSREDTSGLRQS
jgi:hypothetical protein